MPELTPLKVLRISLPTLLLFYSLSWSAMPNLLQRREVFGNSDTYLDIVFPTSNETGFSGTVVIENTEHKIQGKLKGVTYSFQTDSGHFIGTLSAPVKGCEPVLNFSLIQQGRVLKKGVLKAGFCQSI